MILLTGGTGFLGSSVLKALVNTKVRCLGRQKPSTISDSSFYQSEINACSDFTAAFKDINVIIHCAACVHVMNDSSKDTLEEFREVNTYGTLNLAQQAANAGVKRFIFISSIKVNGESTELGSPFKPDDVFIPIDLYGLSKYEAEIGLRIIAKDTGMEVVIIRPPLVYGPGVKANFASMMKWVGRPVPLPFGAIYNKRALVALDNLVSFIGLCADREKSPKAANQIFLISDGEDMSTTRLFRKVRQAFNLQSPSGIKARLVPVPVFIMTFFAKLLGKGGVSNRLFASLQVDSSKARDLLGWEPVITMDEQLAKMVIDT